MVSKVPLAQCESCALKQNPGLRGSGCTEPDILVIGEGPWRTEIELGKVFVGRSGQLLRDTLKAVGLDEKAWITNAALCLGETDKDKRDGAEHCHERLLAEIAERKPRLIMTLGNIPTDALLGKERAGGITKRRGLPVRKAIGDREYVVLPTFHPAAILRDASKTPDFVRDFEFASKLLEQEDKIRITRVVPEVKYEITTDYPKVLQESARSTFAVLDLETTGLNMVDGKILCAVVQNDTGCYILPQETIYNPGFQEMLGGEIGKQINWSGHNSKFDRNWLLYHTGVGVDFAVDTMLMAYLVDERQEGRGLKQMAQRLFGASDWEGALDEYRNRKDFQGYQDIPQGVLYHYAAMDGYWQYKLTQHLGKALVKQPALLRVLHTLLMPGSNALSTAEVRGVRVDGKVLQDMVPLVKADMDDTYREMERIAGYEFNPRSYPQVAKILFDDLGMREIDGRSTNTKNVLMLYDDPHPFVPLLITYRDLSTVYSRYLKSLEESIYSDGRVHTNFNLDRTRTGRLSSNGPNLQNLTRKRNHIRRAFLADEGKVFSRADQSQIELRMIAYFSEDAYLMEAFLSDRDIHGELAEQVYGPNYTKEQRDAVKPLNFGQRKSGRSKTRSIAGTLKHTLARWAMAISSQRGQECPQMVQRLTALPTW